VYAARITAPGLKPWSEERAFDPRSRIWSVKLEPITESTVDWSARVVDARSGEGVAGAKAHLEESPGSGTLAKGVSAADGAIAIKDIPVGRINRVKAGVLPRGRRAAVVLVEAAGYASARLPVVSGGEAQTVRLTPLAPVEEVEPNNSVADPESGRLVQPDSQDGVFEEPETLNRYAFAFNDPVNRVDPWGYGPWIKPIVIPTTPGLGERHRGVLHRVRGLQLDYRNGRRRPLHFRRARPDGLVLHQPSGDRVGRQPAGHPVARAQTPVGSRGEGPAHRGRNLRRR
jgi:hypothetical protein